MAFPRRRATRAASAAIRPAKLLAAGPDEMRRLYGQSRQPAPARRPRAASALLRVLLAHDAPAVRRELEAGLARAGLAHFAAVDVPAMNLQVGEAWQAGELEIHEEHLYSDSLYEVLRPAIARLQQAVRPEAPRVLLTTFPQEPHGLGLLMAQALFALQGCETVQLGVRLPVEQIAAAARAYRTDLVALSFSGSAHSAQVLRGLEELRGMLPVGIRIWAGGSCPALYRRAVSGVRAVADLAAIPDLLAEDFALPPRPM
ncbi:cobalamin B12-binding domain-containing protein [Ramlibacter sp.]|uniref:cobalamin B12-binding domain-containing protein n=1 Tax=Ramlibacter sp. TaxID=1917967 RepID=UPI0017DFEA80|nr:cobalamin B12-binding domain-containing protein [Ramlibacter sp.]MBA2673291.1 cobalamin B12-binding domain-containing protein [Ramlibacter sp.]